MARVLQCDKCKKIESPATALDWIKVDYETRYILAWGMPSFPMTFCSMDCLTEWAINFMKERIIK